MRFLFLSPVVWNFYKLQNQLLALSLAKEGYEVMYAEPVKYKNWQKNKRFHDLSDNGSDDKLKIIKRFFRRRKSFISFIYENINNTRQIARHKPDVVVCYDHLMGLIPCMYCYFNKIHFIFNVSDDWDNVPQAFIPHKTWKYIIKPIIKKFSFAIASISHKQLQLYKLTHKRAFLLPNGVENSFREDINSLHENKKMNLINFIAHLRDWYDFELLFDVFSELPNITLHIYGTGELLEALSEKAKQHNNIHIMGSVSHKETARLLKDSFIGIIPLKNNLLNDSTCPVKLFDYWAARKAVVATPTFELQQTGSDCILFAKNKEEWIKQIRFLMDNPERRSFLSNTGYEKIVDYYNYDVLTQKFIEQLEKMQFV